MSPEIDRRLRGLRAAAWAAAIVAVLPLAYLAAAFAGALLPRNPLWQEPEHGVQIFVRTNGVHCDLVLPAQAAGVDWHALAAPEDVPGGRASGDWVAMGWGQREFYLRTREWADLEVSTAVRALLGGDALMHVEHLPRPTPSASYRPLRLGAEGYRRMADAVADAFTRDERGRPIPLPQESYYDYDVFYEAEGLYHAFRTSNQWTADMLAIAGVRVGIWTPFEIGVMWRIPRPEARPGSERASAPGATGTPLPRSCAACANAGARAPAP